MKNPFAGMRVLLPVLTAVAAMGVPVSAAAAAPACTPLSPSEASAAAMAKACGHDVVVGPSRSEYAQIVAKSDGRLLFESAVVPQRAKQPGGGWADIDLTLTRGKDGLRPRVSIADVAFSAGGDAPMATVTRDGKKFTMLWQGRLPAPIVSGDSATYANVLSGVDLVVRATRTGFTHVLVVKTPAAAASVRDIRFGLGGDATLTTAADGSMRAVAGGTVVAHAKPAVMWDSSTAGDPSSARGAGDAARIRGVKTEVAGKGLVLRPDSMLLDAPASAYPLYVDPDWEYGSASGQKWAYATSNNNGNTDYSVARVGKDPNSSTVYRSFFEFPTTSNGVSLSGKHIQSAYVHMRLTHSSSCSYQYNYMYLTPVINATMKASWSSMALSAFLAEQQGRANTSGCGADQGDMDMNFFGSTTSQVQTAATGGWSNITVGFAARDTGGGGESTDTRWMKYYPENAALVVEYDSIPGTPTGLKVAGVDCPSGTMTVGTLTPDLSAVYPDADSSQTLTGSYEWIEAPSGGVNGDTLRVSRNESTSGNPLKAPSKAVSPGWSTVNNVMATDFDNDGKDDLLGLNGTDQLLLWRSISTSAKFDVTAAYDLGTGWSTIGKFLPPGDFDGDGKPEIAGYNTSGDQLFIHRNTSTPGNPSKTGGTYVSSGWATVNSYMVTDFDGDGKDDILGLNGTDNLLVWRSISTSTKFDFAPYKSFGTGWSVYNKFLPPADFSGDGKPDLAAYSTGSDKLYMYRNQSTVGNPVIAPASFVSSGWATVNNHQVTDYDRDGKADILGFNGTDQLLLWRSTSTSTTFSVTSYYDFGGGWAAYGKLFPPADYDGDGKADISGIDHTKATDTYPSRMSPTLTASASANGRAWTSALPTLTKGKIYAYRVKTTDPSPYYKSSPWSAWCQFTVDTTVPQVSVSAVSAPAGPGKPGTFKITSSATDVSKFKYGWGAATTEVAASGTPKSATVTLSAPKFGKNILFVSAVDATLNEGFGSVEFTVGRPAPAVARWGLETYPGMTQAGALADQQPTLAGNTPLVIDGASSWDQDLRLMGGSTLNPRSSSPTHTSGPVVLDTRNSFSVATWLRPIDANLSYNVALSQEGVNTSGFMLYSAPDKKTWGFVMYDTDSTSTAGTFVFAPLTLHTWQHIAIAYDAPSREMKIYLNGVLAERKTRGAGTAWQSTGKFHLGWGKWGTNGVAYSPGQAADVQVFDRTLVDQDFTGVLAADPASGGFNEPGILTPVKAGGWDFSAGVSCWVTNVKDTCEAPDNTGWSRWLSLSRGAHIAAGHSTSDSGLWVDAAYFPDEGNTETGTQEFGQSAYKMPDDGSELTTWQNTPVLRTDQSFTVSAWVMLNEAPTGGNHSVLSQDGVNVSGFFLGTRVSNGQHYWGMSMVDTDAVQGTHWAASLNTLSGADAGRWTHLTGVYDAGRGEVRLYVNGVLQEVEARTATPWQAGGPFTVGRSQWSGGPSDGFGGAVDEIAVYQGAMTTAAIANLYAGAQS